jgi:drug/metabolite transporter (DMT)-like permease
METEWSVSPDPAHESTRIPGHSAALLLALTANFLLTSADATAKLLTSRYPVSQVIAMQVTFGFVPVMAVFARVPTRLRIGQPHLVLMRGLFAGLGTLCSFYAYSVLPLPDVYAIIFSAPIVVTIVSALLLHEQVGRQRWAAVLVGFIGVLTMIEPSATRLTLGHAAAFGAMLTTAMAILIMRQARQEDPKVMVAAVMLGLLSVSLPGCITAGRVPALADLCLAAIAGLIMGLGNFMILAAVRRASAALIAPTQYTTLIWGLLYGVLLFDTPFRLRVVLGAFIVTASSLFILHRERVRRAKAAASG